MGFHGKAGPGRPKGLQNKATIEVKTWTRAFLSDPEYVESAKGRVMRGEAPHLETLWHHYAWGKPTDTVKVEGNVPAFVLKLQESDE